MRLWGTGGLTFSLVLVGHSALMPASHTLGCGGQLSCNPESDVAGWCLMLHMLDGGHYAESSTGLGSQREGLASNAQRCCS